MSGWVPALRVARREARRARGRSVLVIAMIGLPMMALAFAAATYDMFNLRTEERLPREMGQADAEIQWISDGPIVQMIDGDGFSIRIGIGNRAATDHTAAGLLSLLPPGSTVIPGVQEGSLSVRTAAGVGTLNTAALDLTSPITYGMGKVSKGRAPTADGEVALTAPAARRLGVTVGDTVTSTGGNSTSYRVVGLVEIGGQIEETILFPAGRLPDAGPVSSWLIDTPGPVTWSMVQDLNKHGMLVNSRAVRLDPPPEAIEASKLGPAELGILVLVAGLALLEVVLLAGPAFAVSARRRQRQLALVAANGGTPAHIRRIVLADGLVLGLAGAVVGLCLGVGGAFAGRPLIEQYLAGERAGAYRVYPLALVAIAGLAILTGLAAAMVPAFSAARQNVVAALSGRRGIVRSRKRWLLLGLVMLALGSGVVLYGTWQVSAQMMLVGLVIAELGLVLATPALVGLVSRLGGGLPVSLRIALRDTARNRAAAAPAISAVMAAVAGSVALAVYLGAERAQQTSSYEAFLPYGYVSVGLNVPSDREPIISRAPEETVRATADRVEPVLRQYLPVAELVRINRVGCAPDRAGPCVLRAVIPPENRCPYAELRRELTKAEQKAARKDPRCTDETKGQIRLDSAIVDDGTVLKTLTGADQADLEAATATLRAGGAVVSDPFAVKDGKVTLQDLASLKARGEGGITVPGYVLRSGYLNGIVVAPSVAERAGMVSRLSEIVVATTRMPTQAESDALTAALERESTVRAQVERGPEQKRDPVALVLAIAAGVITLGAAGIATGLAAADGRADLSTLAAVGASPRVRRTLSLSQSGVISGLGSLLGAAAGLGMAVSVLAALNQRYADIWPAPAPYPISVPWFSLGLSLLVVPAVAMAGAGLLTRSRLPIERRTG